MADSTAVDVEVRAKLAVRLVLIGVVGIFAVSAFAVWLVGDRDRAEMMRLVFASILPLLGTWVGTVLAFYFARDSLEAATSSTERLLKGADPQTPVERAMIPRWRLVALEVASGTDPKSVLVTDLTALMKSKDVHRLPVLDPSGAVRYVVHESTINAFARAVSRSIVAPPQAGVATAAPDPLAGKSIADLLGVPELKEFIEAIAVVGLDATVADARTAMGAVKGCNDVFVTGKGQRDDPLLGWLTNTDLARFSD